MNLYMLVQSIHLPIPKEIKVVQDFGEEVVFDGVAVHSGNSMLLQGEPAQFQDWLRPFAGVWISNSPVLGQWKVVHVKPSTTEKADEVTL